MIKKVLVSIGVILGVTFFCLGVVLHVDAMPHNAAVVLCRDRTYVSPPCIDLYGYKHYGFSSELHVQDNMVTIDEAWSKGYKVNEECRDTVFVWDTNDNIGGFDGKSKPYNMYLLFGEKHSRWNKDGSWNW